MSKIAFLMLLFAAFGYGVYENKEIPQLDSVEQSESSDIKTVKTSIADEDFVFEIVDTEQTRQQGLSGRLSLPDNYGMLFVFDEPDNYSFWMKDMNFSIDIIWLNESKEIIHIEKELSPETYPQPFLPNDNALYVLEVNSGVVDNLGLEIGDSINW